MNLKSLVVRELGKSWRTSQARYKQARGDPLDGQLEDVEKEAESPALRPSAVKTQERQHPKGSTCPQGCETHKQTERGKETENSNSPKNSKRMKPGTAWLSVAGQLDFRGGIQPFHGMPLLGFPGGGGRGEQDLPGICTVHICSYPTQKLILPSSLIPHAASVWASWSHPAGSPHSFRSPCSPQGQRASAFFLEVAGLSRTSHPSRRGAGI